MSVDYQALEADIKSGNYSMGQLSKRYPDCSVGALNMVCQMVGLRKARLARKHARYDAQRDIITRMWNEGKTDADIMAVTGFAIHDVKRARHRFGLFSNVRQVAAERRDIIEPLWRAGKSDRDIGVLAGMTRDAVRQFRLRHGFTSKAGELKPQRIAVLEPLFKRGMTDAEIALETEFNRATIRKYRKGLGYHHAD